jgi:uncharacterized membrane protein
MEQLKIFNKFKLEDILRFIFWVLLLAFSVKFVLKALLYFGLQKEVFQRYWNYKWWLLGHIVGGLVALVTGPFQFSQTFRKKYLALHRWLGRIYLTAILIGVISATYLSWTSALAIHWTWAVSLQCLGIVWICTGCMAYLSIRQGRIQAHKEWMIKSYVATFAFVSFRWIIGLPAIVSLGSFIERAPTVLWVSWVIPLFVTNLILQWTKK